MKSAVLFLVFNRPDTTKQVFDLIKKAKPNRLYIAADGPRIGRVGEQEKCDEVRRIATSVDWDCELKTLFRDENLGCKYGVSGGIDWFFSQEEEGIILEDDILPGDGFFQFCDELLERYRNDMNIGMITGCNLAAPYMRDDSASYFFSKNMHIWGWATWQRTWKLYDINMSGLNEWCDKGGLRNVHNNKMTEKYWRYYFDATKKGEIDTWDYQFIYSCWLNNMICITSIKNQTKNIGFDERSTHTKGKIPKYIERVFAEKPIFPLIHPACVAVNNKYDKLLSRHVFQIGIIKNMKAGIRRFLNKI